MMYFKTLLFLLFPVFLLAQQPYLRQFTNDDGLPSLVIYSISQDDNGFLWIGTDNGFCRFDGKEFTNYKSNKAKDNEFIGVYTAPTNITWCWNMSGQVFRLVDNKLELFTGKNLPIAFTASKVVGDKDGNIWLSASDWRKKHYYVCDKEGNCTKQTNFATDKEIYDFIYYSFENNDRKIDFRKSTFFGHSDTKGEQMRPFFKHQVETGRS